MLKKKNNCIGNIFSFVGLYVFSVLLLCQNYALNSYKGNAIMHAMTYCLNGRDYDPCNHLFCPVAFQSHAHAIHQRNFSISNLRFRAHANRPVPSVCRVLPLLHQTNNNRKIVGEDREYKWRNISLSRSRALPFPFLRLIFAIHFNRSSAARNRSLR